MASFSRCACNCTWLPATGALSNRFDRPASAGGSHIVPVRNTHALRPSLLLSVAFCLCFPLFSAACVFAQLKKTQESPAIAQAVAVEHPPRLDGTLDDPLWQAATPITDFRQREPYEGEAVTEHSEVRIVYTKGEIYFGIACFDSEPGKIIATQLRRDISQELD